MPLSFKLHAELAEEHGGVDKWGYRRVHVGQLSAKGRLLDGQTKKNGVGASDAPGASVSLQKRTKEDVGKMRAAGMPKDLDWFAAESVRSYDEMGTPETTAQVHPYQFTTSMASLAEEKGAKIVLGRVIDLDPKSKKITYEEKETKDSKTIEATDIVIAAGPWTRSVFPSAPISALRAHSVAITPSNPISAYAIFTEISLPAGFQGAKSRSSASPEIYARPNNEAYCCGEGDTLVPLPSTTADVDVDESRCQDIIDQVGSISDELRNGTVTAKQACYLPNVSSGGGPLIGKTGYPGVFIAAGHTCWGIQNGPGTGKLISEFVFDGKAKSANVSGLAPQRYL